MTDLDRCETCNAVLPPDGRCIECVTTKPWMRASWRVRRAEVIVRTSSCELCRAPFGPGSAPQVNHLRRYRTEDGRIDWMAYWAMVDDDVEVICGACHRTYSETGKRRVPPRPCKHCGKPTSTPSGTCGACALGWKERRQEREARQRFLDSYWEWRCTCDEPCPMVNYLELNDSGDEVGGGCGVPACWVDAARSRGIRVQLA